MATTAYVGGRLLAPGATSPRPATLVVDGDRIASVGAAPPPAGAEIVDVAGTVILPGLVDAHAHLANLGALEREVDLAGSRGEEEAARRVAAAASRLPPGSWVRGRNWDQVAWGGRYPTRATLDAVVPDRPVVLWRVDGHAAWVNGAALAAAGMGRETAEVPGGAMPRDERGELTGLLIDAAMDALVAALPPQSPRELETDLAAGARRVAARGLTGMHEMGTTPAMLAALDALEAAGRLAVRVTCYLFGSRSELAPLLAARRRADGLVRVAGVKLLLDGALGSHGAALLAPYGDAPDRTGLVLHDAADRLEWARFAAERDVQLALHAIGDRANVIAVELAAEARRRARGSPPRHRIEHAQIVPAELLPRFARERLVASVQPIHGVDDRAFAGARLGPERLATAYPLRRFLEAGVPVALGSDAPVASESPWWGLQAAVARTTPGVDEAPAHLVSEAIPLARALEGYTSGASLAAGEPWAGLAPGAPADFVIVDRDPFAIPPRELGSVRPLATVVAGRVTAGTFAG